MGPNHRAMHPGPVAGGFSTSLRGASHGGAPAGRPGTAPPSYGPVGEGAWSYKSGAGHGVASASPVPMVHEASFHSSSPPSSSSPLDAPGARVHPQHGVVAPAVLAGCNHAQGKPGWMSLTKSHQRGVLARAQSSLHRSVVRQGAAHPVHVPLEHS